MMSGTTVALIVVALLAWVLAGLVSAAAAAVLRVTRTSLADELAEAERTTGHSAKARAARIRRAKQLSVDPTATVASLSVIRTTAELIGAASLTLLIARWLPHWWHVLLVVAAVGLIAGLFMAQVSPRQLGFRRPTNVILRLTGLISAVTALTGWAAKHDHTGDDPDGHQEEYLREMVDRAGDNEVIESDERELITNVFDLGDTYVREIMVPRTEMVTIAGDATLRNAMRLFLRSGYSRVPVTGSDLDDMVGIAYLKDIARTLEADPLAGDRAVRGTVRPCAFVPESKPIDDLLRDMQTRASHIAVVVDEYGGIAGLVTIEDILEELVGELTDEHDVARFAEPEEVKAGVYRVPARLPVDELGDLFGLRLDDDDVDTVGGLLAKALGKVPLAGSQATYEGVNLAAERVGGRRKQVETVLVSRVNSDNDQGKHPHSERTEAETARMES
ncbi:MAG: hemolysin family protein [Cellulomonadaceae bacterium]|jgi:CBS domain containing-hemolysin-like protein|nr:hemolysin family protein [Cellulomonadaceae bacterium]